MDTDIIIERRDNRAKTHCNTLQHTATYCNTLQDTMDTDIIIERRN